MSPRGAPIGAYLALGAQALTPIVIGSFSSLKTPKALRRTLRQKRKGKASKKAVEDQDDSEDEDEEDEEEHLTLMDSLLFPLLGSVALLSLYFLLKYVGPETINMLIGGYFGFLGIFAVQNTSTVLLRFIQRLLSITPKTYHLRISSQSNASHIHQRLTIPTLLLLPISIGLPPLYIYLGKPWYLTNILGLAFSQGAIQMLKLDSFKTGAALLGGLFFYDIFWVFGTPVMVTVAKGLDAPIKILAPKAGSNDFALLGLGDIVVPGLVVALCLRYDYARANRTKQIQPHQSFPKPYFYTVLTAYILGLTTTVVVMHTFQAAQPALLYLSPACVGAPVLLAVANGQLKDLWTWTDEDTSENSEVSEVDAKTE